MCHALGILGHGPAGAARDHRRLLSTRCRRPTAEAVGREPDPPPEAGPGGTWGAAVLRPLRCGLPRRCADHRLRAPQDRAGAALVYRRLYLCAELPGCAGGTPASLVARQARRPDCRAGAADEAAGRSAAWV